MDLTNLNKDRTIRRKNNSLDMSTMVFGKVPPQAKDLEMAVLGAIMLEKEAFDVVSEIIKPECFYVESHQKIYRCMQSLAQKNNPIDLLTVVEELRFREELDIVGGPSFVMKLTSSVASSANITAHARIVFQKFLARELIVITNELNSMAYEDGQDAFELIDYAENRISEIGLKNIGSGMVGIDNVLIETLKKIEGWRKVEGVITGIPSGFSQLDRATRGWQPGDLILLGARPSGGKTAFALQIARYAAKQNKSVAIWSLEMKSVYLVLRMLSSESKITLYKIQTGSLSDDEMQHIYKNSVKTLSGLDIFFDENTNINIQSLRRKARRLKKTNNLGLILIDYVQLMSGNGDSKNREQEIAKISRDLKNLAQELDIPIIALSQLSRTEGAKNISWEYGPPANALRESGALEQDADVIMMLWGPGDDDIARDPTLDGKRKVRIVKQRNGVLITEELDFKSEIQLFEAIEKIYPHTSNLTPVKEADERFSKGGAKLFIDDKDDETPF